MDHFFNTSQTMSRVLVVKVARVCSLFGDLTTYHPWFRYTQGIYSSNRSFKRGNFSPVMCNWIKLCWKYDCSTIITQSVICSRCLQFQWWTKVKMAISAENIFIMLFMSFRKEKRFVQFPRVSAPFYTSNGNKFDWTLLSRWDAPALSNAKKYIPLSPRIYSK